MRAEAKKVSGELVFEGLRFKVYVDQVLEPRADTPARRDWVGHPRASAVVPLLDDGRGVVLVRQYRYASRDFLWELPAGVFDEGEDPAACAGRELEEETGWRAGRIEHLAGLRTSPGFSNELIQVYLASGLSAGERNPDPGEHLESGIFTFGQALAMIERGEITDAKTVSGLLLAARKLGILKLRDAE